MRKLRLKRQTKKNESLLTDQKKVNMNAEGIKNKQKKLKLRGIDQYFYWSVNQIQIHKMGLKKFKIKKI